MDKPSQTSVLNWLPIMVILILIGLVTTYIILNQSAELEAAPELTIPQSACDSLLTVVQDILVAYDLEWKTLTKETIYPVQYQVSVPLDLPIPALHLDIQDAVHLLDAQIINAHSDPLQSRVVLQIGIRDSILLRLSLQTAPELVRERGKIALLIDDFGDRYDPFVESFLNLTDAMTISIIPGLPYSQRVCNEARKIGCETILHLPMEPFSAKYNKSDFMILSNLTEPDVRKRVQKALESLPDVIGMNNHMGSKITSNRRIITYVLDEIKKKDLYFLDSRTSHKSVGFKVATSMDIRCGKRDVFLDTYFEKDKIRAQVGDLAEQAKKKGFAVGLGHCHRNTLEILREEIPKLKERGFRFVYVSDIIR